MSARAALYLRVSTDKQSTEAQRAELLRYALARELAVVQVYDETASASARHRPAFEAMMAAARRRDFDVVVVWALDRFGRSIFGNLRDLVELDHLKVGLLSVREPWMDTSGPMRTLLVAFASWVAEQEHTRLKERTRLGLERARAKGKRLGRPAKADPAKVRALRAAGRSWSQVAGELGCTESAARRAAKRKSRGEG